MKMIAFLRVETSYPDVVSSVEGSSRGEGKHKAGVVAGIKRYKWRHTSFQANLDRLIESKKRKSEGAAVGAGSTPCLWSVLVLRILALNILGGKTVHKSPEFSTPITTDCTIWVKDRE